MSLTCTSGNSIEQFKRKEHKEIAEDRKAFAPLCETLGVSLLLSDDKNSFSQTERCNFSQIAETQMVNKKIRTKIS